MEIEDEQDRSLVEQLYLDYEKQLYKLAKGILHDHYDAQDCVHNTIVSVITSGNAASCALHEKFGFTFCGTIKRVGKKFGKFLDIDNYYCDYSSDILCYCHNQ